MIQSIRSHRSSCLIAAIATLTILALAGSSGAYGEEYKNKAQKTKMFGGNLAAFDGQEANIIRFELPPGHVGGKHYHTGDVFVYVEKGSFTVEAGGKTQIFEAGQVYHETPDVPMVARNTSTTDGATIVIFQVGKSGKPIMVKAK